MHIRTAFILFILLTLLGWPAMAAPGYERSINDGWQFRKEGSAVTQTVSLPHTWNAADAMDDEPGYWRGTAWYGKTIPINDELAGRKVFVRFEGANQEVDLYVNGSHAGNHKGGYTAFIFDITGLIRKGANDFKIKVDNSHDEAIPPMSADFTFFGGIYRDVSLVFLPENHISIEHYASSGIYISTPAVSKEEASVQIETRLSLPSPEKKMTLEHAIFDPEGRQVASIRQSIRKPAAEISLKAEARISNPRLWDVDSPEMYSVVTRLLGKDGQEIDSRRSSFGIRSFRFDPEKGFFLNGRPLKLIGTNRHQDFRGLGNALPDGMHLRDIRLLKDMGGNFLRISHYPQDHLVSDECDRLGILASLEIPVVNRIGSAADFSRNCVEMAREMVYQNFNHPSMIVWAYMNEVLLDQSPWKDGGMSKEDYYARVRSCASEIDAALREADPGRPTMIPCDADRKKYAESGLGEIPDILGFNLYFGWYYGKFASLGPALDKLHASFPGKALFVSEYGADADARLHSFEPERKDYSCGYALLFHQNYLPVIMEKEYLAGAAVWNLNDFYSEERGFAVPHFNCKGLVTSDRTPKDSYWFYRATLGKAPFVRIGGSDWKIRGGQEKDGCCIQPVEVFSTAAEVELTANGKSLGKKAVQAGSALFQVPFKGGENVLEARGADGAADLQRVDFRMVPEDMSSFTEISVLLGTRNYFEDRTGGQIWIPEQEYRPGAWGYVGGEKAPASQAGIAGTDLDPLFQTQRAGLEAFKADVPDGKYYVYLHFAELAGGKALIYNLGDDAQASGTAGRVFSVAINGTTVLQDFDIAGGYGYNTAVAQRFAVDINNGKGLSVEFTPVKGLPVLNAIRILRYQ